MFDFLMFDLDDTLIATSSLEAFRGAANVGNQTPAYREALLQAVDLEFVQASITEDFLLELKAAHPNTKFSVVTTVPKFYASGVTQAGSDPTFGPDIRDIWTRAYL